MLPRRADRVLRSSYPRARSSMKRGSCIRSRCTSRRAIRPGKKPRSITSPPVSISNLEGCAHRFVGRVERFSRTRSASAIRAGASELMLIADGTKTVEEVAAATTERSKKHRALLRCATEKPRPPRRRLPSPPPCRRRPSLTRSRRDEARLLREFARLFISERARITCDPKDHDECWMVFNRVKAMLGGAL